jgi:hypothetical protein
MESGSMGLDKIRSDSQSSWGWVRSDGIWSDWLMSVVGSLGHKVVSGGSGSDGSDGVRPEVVRWSQFRLGQMGLGQIRSTGVRSDGKKMGSDAPRSDQVRWGWIRWGCCCCQLI